MKRSTILTITIILIVCEFAYSVAKLNEIYHFFDATLRKKYFVLSAFTYLFSLAWTLIYYLYVYLEILPSGRKKHFKNIFGDKSFNVIYTGHFFLFAACAFYVDAWGYFGSALAMGVVWGWFRGYQNDYAYEYEIERKKEEAKNKPSVILNG